MTFKKGFNPSEEMVIGFLRIAGNYEIVVATKFVNGNALYQSVLGYPELKEKELVLNALPEGTKVFEKTGYGLPSNLVEYLKSNDVSEADVGGLETDACVLAALYSLWDVGIKPSLLKNLSSTPDQKIGEAALIISKRNFGV